ncbi:hypothetical protein NFI96_028083 [Prochilodus magdalenae]|nr:hypothetical protein NFI96_028083 [Prochilodus magdalenae]
MLLAVSRHNLLSCARGHVARLSVTHVMSSRHQHGWEWTRPPGVWSHTLRPRTETKSLQRLKTKFGLRPMCVHLFNHSSAAHVHEQASAGQTVEFRTECIKIAGRANHRGLNRAELLHCTYSSQLHPLNRSLSERVDTGALWGSREFSTKPENQVQNTSEQETRDTEVTQRASSFTRSNEGKFKELYENPWTIPNILCMARIVLSPVLGYLIMEQCFHISFGLFLLAGATDLLDGYIARNWPNQKSALGSALDPLADKVLISVLYISLTCAQLIPVPLTALVISRDIALIAAVFYVRYKTVPPPVTLSKFFNPCYTTAQLKPTLISKVNTAVQLLLVAASLASPIFHYTDSVLLQSLWYITALTTTASGYSYYHYGRKTVEVLNNTK